MYKIYADGVCIFDDASPDAARKLIDPKLTLSAGAAGSLTMGVPQTNAGYATIQRLTTTITVRLDRDIIWTGRVLGEKKDFWGTRQLFCEGALAFLNDSVQGQTKYAAASTNIFLTSLLIAHNAQVPASRKIYAGTITQTDPAGNLDRYTDYGTTWEIISKQLVGELGGILRAREAGGMLYLDYLADYPAGTAKAITFGDNLLDFTRNWDLTDFCTVILPRGARLNGEEGIGDLSVYTTIDEATATLPTGYTKSGNYLISPAASTYGWIAKVVDFSDLDDPNTLQAAGVEWLEKGQFSGMSLEASAVDMRLLDPSEAAIGLLDRVQVKSPNHGLDAEFAVTGMAIPLDAAEKITYTLNSTVTPYKRRVLSLTEQTQKKFESVYKDEASLEVRDNAIIARVSNAEGDISTLTQTATSLESRITDAEGNISTLSQTATSLTSRISNAEGDISTLQQTASMLSSQISNAQGDISTLQQTASSLGSRITDAEGNISTLSQTASSLGSRITDAEGNISTLSQTASSLTSRISNAEGNISTLTQTASSLTSRISSAEGDISTLTQTATSLGSRISSAEGDISTLTQTATSLGSRISSAEGDISTLEQTADDITAQITDSRGNYTVLNLQSDGLHIGNARGTTTIDGDCLTAGTVYADYIIGNTIDICSSNGTAVGSIYARQSSVYASSVLEFSCNAGIATVAPAGNAYVYGFLGVELEVGNPNTAHVWSGSDLLPNRNNAYWLGNSQYLWNDIWATNSNIGSSDRTDKKEISYDLAAYDALFDALRPCSYQFVENAHGRTHTGLIAQDVEQALADCGLDSMDFAAFIKSPFEEDGETLYRYGLRYGELVSLCIRQIQLLKARVTELEG